MKQNKSRGAAAASAQTRVAFPGRGAMVAHFLRGSLAWFFLAILSVGIVSLMDLASPRIIGFTIDSVIGSGEDRLPAWLSLFVRAAGGRDGIRARLWTVALLVLAVALVRAVFRFCFEFFNTKGAERLVKTMRDDLFGHILRLPGHWHSQHSTGDLIQRCTSDVETVKTFLSDQLTTLFRTVILLALSLVFMFRIHVNLACAAAVFLPVIIFYSLIFHGRIAASFQKADQEEGKLSAIAQENLTGVRVVRAFGREVYERKRFEDQNRYYTGYWVSLMKTLSLFWSSGDLVSYAQTLVILAYGSVLAVRGKITAGDLIAFLSYNELLTWPIRALGRTIADMSKAGISVDRLREIMNAREEEDAPSAVRLPLTGDITFDHVSFGYGADSEPVLKDVSFKIPAGKVCGILGGTGSGKSTLVHLLDRLYDLPEGSGWIRIGGADIRTMQRRDLRRQIGLVLQEPYLFSGTIAENIAMAGPDFSQEDVEEAARLASLDLAVAHFAKGYDTFVGERGVTLSGGQKQRAAIAQTLIRRPSILIFDDSLSAVDAETDAKIRSSLEDLRKEADDPPTMILISHRISTLMRADSILVLDKGRVLAQGRHEDLLERSPVYRKIYDLQMQGTEELQMEKGGHRNG